MDFTKLETEPLRFANWEVVIKRGTGEVKETFGGETVAKFLVTKEGRIIQFEGETKFSDMALVALRTFVRDREIKTCVS